VPAESSDTEVLTAADAAPNAAIALSASSIWPCKSLVTADNCTLVYSLDTVTALVKVESTLPSRRVTSATVPAESSDTVLDTADN
jgi:hypothetical protein